MNFFNAPHPKGQGEQAHDPVDLGALSTYAKMYGLAQELKILTDNICYKNGANRP
jgi:hypothetical protein